MGIENGQECYGWDTSEASECHSYVLPKLLALLPGDKLKILDMGCGNGYVANQLSLRGHKVTGIDLSKDGIELAQNTYPNTEFIVRSVYEDLADLGNDFDLIISSEVIEHLYYPKKFLQNAWLALKPGGVIILSTPYHGWAKNVLLSVLGQWDKHHTVDWEGGHIKFFSERTISAMLLEAKFSNIKFDNAGRVKWLWKSMVLRAQKK